MKQWPHDELEAFALHHRQERDLVQREIHLP